MILDDNGKCVWLYENDDDITIMMMIMKMIMLQW